MFGREWDLMTLERASLVMSDAADGLYSGTRYLFPVSYEYEREIY